MSDLQDVADGASEPKKTSGGDGFDEAVALRAAPSYIEVHPLVLISVVDHFARSNAKVSITRRVSGLLLGNYLRPRDGKPPTLDVNNCFAVPFDEDLKDNAVWFFDTNYAEEMYRMFRKVLPKVRVVGWYTSGIDIKPSDLDIHLLIAQRFCPNPVYCIINTDPLKKGMPVVAYTTTEAKNGTHTEFRHAQVCLGTLEPEEIAVEHLLRDLTDTTHATLATKIQDRQLSLLRLETMLGHIEDYLNDVADGTLPVSHEVLFTLQELLDLLPLLHQKKTSNGMLVAQNDEALGTMLAAIARCVMALNDAILNRRRLMAEMRDKEREALAEKEKSEKQKTASTATKAPTETGAG